MKRIGAITAVLFLVLTGAITAMATEEAPYTVIKTDGIFELREYAPQVLAEIMVDGELEGAGNKAFRPLFRYISGDNQSQTKIAMTAPVSQEQQGEEIAMIQEQKAALEVELEFIKDDFEKKVAVAKRNSEIDG